MNHADPSDSPTPWSVHEFQKTDGSTTHHLLDARGYSLIRAEDVIGRSGPCAVALLQKIADSANSTSPEVMELARIVHQQDRMGVSQSSKRHHASSLLALHMVGAK